MQFKDIFCPSPWFHMRINNDGYYEYCRWQTKYDRNQYEKNITDIDPSVFFHKHMSNLRSSMLNGYKNDICDNCYKMEQHNKISGRQRQLLKIGVNDANFEKSLLSSPWLPHLKYSNEHGGLTKSNPVDLQVDLGNYCNSGCVFCVPSSSSTIASEYKNLGLIDKLPINSWCNDENSLNKFIKYVNTLKNVYYIHFIGGETIITPAFKKILKSLIGSGLSSEISIGFTTNLTVWDEEINSLLMQFKTVNLGLSIEALHKVNDYVRWPSRIHNVIQLLDKWVLLGKKNDWLIQLRITPTILSVLYIDTIYEYAIKHRLPVESCDFLDEPRYMRISVLPMEYRKNIIDKMENFINKYHINDISSECVINTRNMHTIDTQLIQDASSYIEYLRNEKDETYYLPDLIKFLKIIEKSRNNSIIDYLPEYEELFRTAGY